MKELSGLARKLVCSPWTYLYWAVSGAGIICAHLNSGLSGSPLLGAASIASTLIGLGIFYFHLNKLRNELGFPPKRTAAGLFFSIYAFRLRLLLLFSPVFGFIFWQGTFGRLATEYLSVTLASPEAKFRELIRLLSNFWLLLATIIALIFLDLAGRSRVVAQGHSVRVLRQIPRTIGKLITPLLILVAAQLVLFSVGEYFAFMDYINLGNKITPSLLSALALEPIDYVLAMVSVFYLAKRSTQKTADQADQ